MAILLFLVGFAISRGIGAIGARAIRWAVLSLAGIAPWLLLLCGLLAFFLASHGRTNDANAVLWLGTSARWVFLSYGFFGWAAGLTTGYLAERRVRRRREAEEDRYVP